MAESNAERQKRHRRHVRNDHTLCDPARCDGASSAPGPDPNGDPTDGKPATERKPATKRYQYGDYDLLAPAMETGDQRIQLVALRDYLARRLDSWSCAARDAAPLAQRLTDVIKALAELPDPAGVSDIDELERARRERRARTRQAAGQ